LNHTDAATLSLTLDRCSHRRRHMLKGDDFAGTLIGLAFVATGQQGRQSKCHNDRHDFAKPSHHSLLVESLKLIPGACE
jgi:hypothetical protein